MSITTLRKDFSMLALTQNLIAVETSANERLLAAARKTAEATAAEAEKAAQVIAEQAQEIAALKGRVIQLTTEMEQQQSANEAVIKMAYQQNREVLISNFDEETCYRHVGSFTCCASVENFRAHLKADWATRADGIPYHNFLTLFMSQLYQAKIPGSIAQTANDFLIEWFPNACSNLKTCEETKRREEEQVCYGMAGSFTCCLSLDSFRAHLKADWELRKASIPYRHFLSLLCERLHQAKIPGPIAQAANDSLIEWFPNACSNLKTYEETRKGFPR